MDEFNVLHEPEDEDEEFQAPPYGKEGRILVRVLGRVDTTYKYEIEVLDYDVDTGVFWINEGTGFEWWVDEFVDNFPADEGVFVIEGVKGAYIRGDGWTTDDDEEWEFTGIRAATSEEIASECL